MDFRKRRHSFVGSQKICKRFHFALMDLTYVGIGVYIMSGRSKHVFEREGKGAYERREIRCRESQV